MALQPQKKGPTISGHILLIALLVVSIGLTTVYAREGDEGPVHLVQGAFSDIVSPFKLVGASVGSAGGSVAKSLEDITTSDGTIQSERERSQELVNLLAQYEEILKENKELRALLKLTDMYDMDTVAARVIGNTTNSWQNQVTIDKGSDDGIKAGLSVMGSSGLVGQVIEVSKNTSQIRLLKDPQSAISVFIQSSRAEGTVRGALDGLLYLEDIDSEAEIIVGDLVITSGLGGTYSKGLLVGTVVRVDRDGTIVVSPNEEAGLLEHILVVTNLKTAPTFSANTNDSGDSNGGSDDDGSSGDDSGDSGSGDGGTGDDGTDNNEGGEE